MVIRVKVCLASLLLMLVCVCPRLANAQVHCGVASDLVVQALEQLSPASNPDQLDDALQLLKHATQQCAGLGDAWYYRSLIEHKLGQTRLAEYALGKARELTSDALSQNKDPFVLASPEAVPANTPVHQKWALIVGISKFQDHNVPSLHYTRDDAEAFADWLRDPKAGRFDTSHVYLLADEQATTRNIKEKLNLIARSAGDDDLVVIYFATHGSARGLDTAGGLNYLITYDTEIGESQDQDALYATALPMVEVSMAMASRFRARRAALFLDTCYGGGAVPNGTAAPSAATLDHIRQGAGRLIITASQQDQESKESKVLQHGYFTYFLLDALRRKGGSESLTSIFPSVQQQVSQHVLADKKAQQTPLMSSSQSTPDIVLGVPVGASTAASK